MAVVREDGGFCLSPGSCPASWMRRLRPSGNATAAPMTLGADNLAG